MGTTLIGPFAIVELVDRYYRPMDEYEVAFGEVVGPDSTVNVVVRRYGVSKEAMLSDNESPIKFVPLGDIEDNEFDLAIYIPQYLVDHLSLATLMNGIASLIYVGGVTFHNLGPDATSQLG